MKFYQSLLTILLCIAITSLSFSQNVSIPDANFKTALLNHDPVIDTNSDGDIQVTEAAAFSGILNVAASNILDLSGIEYFESITALNCNNNEITSVDLTQNSALEQIEIAANLLTTLDISQNNNLRELVCNGNNLVELYTASNLNLEILNVSANSISDLDLASNTALKSIEINFNPIETIDISNNINLELFSATYCYNLGTVDFSNNNTLENILLWYTNQEEINVSNMPNLNSLYLRNLNLSSLDVSNNPNLYNLYVTNNNIVELDVSSNTNLAYLSVDNLYVSTIDVSNNPNLEWLDLSGSLLETVNAKNGNNTIFTYFNIDNASSLGTICVDDVTYANANFTKPSTSYFSEICSPDDCDSAAVNYTQGFETTIQPFIEVCWRKYPHITTNYNYVNTVGYAYTGNNSVGMRSITNSDALLITPELVDFDATKRVSFWLYSAENSGFNVGTISNPDDITTFEPYRTISINDGGGNQWRQIHVDFENYTGNANHVAFKLSGNYSFAYIDDFVYQESPNCITPIDVEVVTYATEASIDWLSLGNAESWDIEYGVEGFTLGSGTLVNTASKPYVLQELDPNTVYDIYIRSHCAGGDISDWSFVSAFTTLCPAIEAEYTYNFEDGYDGEFYSCWEVFGSGFITQDGNTAASTGAVRISNFNEGTVITPELFEFSSSKRVKFWLKNEDGASDLVVGTLAVQNDLSTFIPYQTISSSDLEEGVWQQIIIDFESYTGNDRYVGFRQQQIDNYAQFYIDEFVYQNTPNCLEPETIEIVEITDVTLGLEWSNTSGNTDWEIEYGTVSFELGTGITLSGSGESATLVNLYPDSAYDIYIRSNCGGGSYSDWFKLQNVRTICGSFSGAFIQDFNTNEFVNCWSRLPIVDPEVSTTNIVNSSNQYPLGGSGNTIKFYDYEQNGDLFLVSPELGDLNNGNKRIKFWLYPRYNNANMVIGTMTDPADPNTFTAKETIPYSDMIYRDWKQFEVLFDDYSGADNYIAFHMQIEEEPVGGTSIIYLDRFEYSDIPTCQEPTDFANTGISNGEIELSWNDDNNATQWEVLYGEEGFWYDDGTVIQVNSNPFSVSGLTTETVYDFYIRAVCDANHSSDWSEKITVDIGCGQSYATGYTYDFNSSTLDACWMAYEYSSNSYTTSFDMVIDNNFGDEGYSAYLEDTSAYSSYGVIMVSPLFTDLSNDKKIEFYISNYDGGLKVGTITDPEDYSTFETLETIEGSIEGNAWEKRTVYLNDYNGTDQYIAFKYQRATSNYGSQVVIDDFSYLQSVFCEVPTGLTVEQAYDNSVELSWVAGESDIEWELEFEQLGTYNSEETITVTSNNFTLDNLLEGTEYDIRVRAKCDDEGLYSDWSEVITFFTTCMPVEDYYFESFEFENAISPCWTKIVETDNTIINIYAVDDFTVSYNGVDRTLYPHSGNQFIQFSNSFDNAGGELII